MKILFVATIIAILIIVGLCIYEHETEDKNICAWCKDLIWEEGSQIREYWLHDLCWSNLWDLSGRIGWRNMVDAERLEWIYGMIKDRQ